MLIIVKWYVDSLANQEQKIAELFNENPLPIVIYDKEKLTILAANYAAQKTYQYSKDFFLKLKINDLLADCESIEDKSQNLAAKDSYFSDIGIAKHKKADGSLFFVNSLSFETRFQLANARILLIYDIDELQRSASNLALINYELNHYKAALEKVSILSVTNKEGEIMYVNKPFLDMTGYTWSELEGRNHNILASGIHNKVFYTKLWHTINTGNLWRGEMCNRNKHGDLYWLQMNIIPIKNSVTEEIDKFLNISFDITERKLSEEQLENKNLKLQKIAWSYSHEIRKPLSSILGLVELLQIDASQELHEEIIQKLEISATELDNIIRELIFLSQEK